MNKLKILVTVATWSSARWFHPGWFLQRLLRAAAWALLGLCCTVSATPAQTLPSETPPKSITVVLDDNYPPFIFRDSAGQIQGILKDSWALWEARTGVAVKLLPMEWAKALQMMQAGQADVIDTIFLTEARQRIYSFSAPYAKLDVPIFFHQSIGGIVDANSLKGFTVGVKAGDACIDVLRAHGVDSTKPYPSYSAVVAAAAAAEVRVFCVDHPPAAYLLNQLGVEKEFRHSVPLYTGEFHRAVRKGNDALLKLVEDGFGRISAAERQQIETKWYGSEIQGPGIAPYARYAAYALLGVALVALALALWNLTLRRRVRSKTAELSSSLTALGLEKQVTEQTLAQMNATLEAIPDLWFEIDLEGRYHHIHASRTDLQIAPAPDFLGKLISEVLPPDAAAVCLAALQEANASGHSSGKQFALMGPHGLMWLELSMARKASLAAETPRFVAIARDITSSKLAQEQLRLSEEKLAITLYSIGDAVIATDPVGRVTRMNPTAERLSGWALAEARGRALTEVFRIINADTRETVADPVQLVMAHGHVVDLANHTVLLARDGAEYQISDSAAPIRNAAGEIVGVVLVFSDVSEKYRAEVALRESEQRYRTAFMTSPDAVNITRLVDGRYLDVNDGFLRMMGHTRDQVIGRTAQELNVWQDLADRRRLVQAMQRDGYCENLDANFVAKDGRVIAGLMSAHVISLQGEQCILSVTRDITARKHAEDALRVAAAAFDAQEGIFVTDPARVILRVNQAFTEITGYSAEEAVGKTRRQLNAERHDGAVNAAIVESVTLKGKWQGEVPNRRKNGEPYTEWLTISSVMGSDGKLSHYVGTLIDISARKAAEESLQLAASVFTHAREGIMITQADGTIINVNQAFSQITGYSRAEVLGQNPRILKSGRQSREFYQAMWRELVSKGQWDGEIWNRRKNGEIYPQMQTVSTVRNEQGKAYYYVSLFSDITAQKAHQQQLEHLAHFDVLTSLPNRVLLTDRLHQAMAQAQRRNQTLAVVYLDLDGFKAVNDHHGHEVGDQLLMTVASRMKQTLREGDTLARLGGDEFIAVLIDLSDVAASVPMLTRLLGAAAQTVQLGEINLQVSTSVGVTFYPQSQDIDADQLLRQADQAMYQAKLAGKNRYHFFDAEQDSSIRGRHESVVRIRQALTEHEFVLYYQPKVDMRSGLVTGAEALIRWRHPEQGLLLPALFLPVIEDHPLAVEIGKWVIDSALTQMELWREAGLNIPVSVNVGANQLQQANFVPRLRELLQAHPGIKAGELELEVLETSALEDIGRIGQVIEACGRLGVGFALDDFGTGYSSLTYLKHLRVTLLKIDRSFVSNMLDDPDDLAILEGVIGLANAFRCQVVAEGVESVAHGALLLQLGCELAQGYGIARPMPAADLPAWVASWRPDPSWAGLSRVRRDDLPLLRAGVEYRAWIAGLESFLKGERQTPPVLDPLHDLFALWPRGRMPAQHDAKPVWRDIEALRQQVRTLAAELLELSAAGRQAQALAQLDRLRRLHQLMLDQLTSLEQESQPADLS